MDNGKILNLSPLAFRTLVFIFRYMYANQLDDNETPRPDQISAYCEMSSEETEMVLRELEGAGWISRNQIVVHECEGISKIYEVWASWKDLPR